MQVPAVKLKLLRPRKYGCNMGYKDVIPRRHKNIEQILKIIIKDYNTTRKIIFQHKSQKRKKGFKNECVTVNITNTTIYQINVTFLSALV